MSYIIRKDFIEHLIAEIHIAPDHERLYGVWIFQFEPGRLACSNIRNLFCHEAAFGALAGTPAIKKLSRIIFVFPHLRKIIFFILSGIHDAFFHHEIPVVSGDLARCLNKRLRARHTFQVLNRVLLLHGN